MLNITVLAFSAILTVDNNVPSIGQFTNIQESINAAIPGDTILVYPSNAQYSAFTVTKTLRIVGSGWQPEGYNRQTIKSTEITANWVTIDANAPNTKLEGLGGGFDVRMHAADTIIDKCCVGTIDHQEGINLIITRCIIQYYVVLRPNGSCCYVTNCIFPGNTGNYFVINTPNASNVSIINNTFLLGRQFNISNYGYSTATIMNNILVTDFNTQNMTVCYNITGGAAGDCIIDSYHTNPGSPAIDAGNPDPMFNDLDGSRNDCGAYGGPTPFVDGGIPGLPAIYQISGDYVVGQDENWQVEIKAKTNRE